MFHVFFLLFQSSLCSPFLLLDRQLAPADFSSSFYDLIQLLEGQSWSLVECQQYRPLAEHLGFYKPDQVAGPNYAVLPQRRCGDYAAVGVVGVMECWHFSHRQK